MPLAGNYLTTKLWRFQANTSDDSVGGSVPSGTILKDPVFARIEQMKATQVLLEQGLEIPDMFQGYLTYTGEPLDLQHNDVLEVTNPPTAIYYQKKFRIVGYRHSSHQDIRRFVEVTMKRHEITRTEDLQ